MHRHRSLASAPTTGASLISQSEARPTSDGLQPTSDGLHLIASFLLLEDVHVKVPLTQQASADNPKQWAA